MDFFGLGDHAVDADLGDDTAGAAGQAGAGEPDDAMGLAGSDQITDGGDHPGVEFDGERYDATWDVDGDGHADSAILTNHDGTYTLLTDLDGDGTADEGALVDADGRVLGAEHMTDDGAIVYGTAEDSPYQVGDRLPMGPGGEQEDANGVDPYEPYDGSERTTTDTGGDATTTTTATTDPTEPTSTGGYQPAATQLAEDPSYTPTGAPTTLAVSNAGSTTVMNANADLDGDGVNETAVVRGPDGSMVAYVDSDGDGGADRVEVYDASGTLTAAAIYDPVQAVWVEQPI